jgi:hypothetical protein
LDTWIHRQRNKNSVGAASVLGRPGGLPRHRSHLEGLLRGERRCTGGFVLRFRPAKGGLLPPLEQTVDIGVCRTWFWVWLPDHRFIFCSLLAVFSHHQYMQPL